MSFVYKIGKGLIDSIPVFVRKVGTVLMFIFTIGLFMGFFLGGASLNPIILIGPLVAMAIMWQDLDLGLLVFIIFLIIVFVMPELIPRLI